LICPLHRFSGVDLNNSVAVMTAWSAVFGFDVRSEWKGNLAYLAPFWSVEAFTAASSPPLCSGISLFYSGKCARNQQQ
jgi:hypothetical protein